MWIVFSNGCATRRGVLVTFDACLCDRILIPFSASVLSRPFLWFLCTKQICSISGHLLNLPTNYIHVIFVQQWFQNTQKFTFDSMHAWVTAFFTFNKRLGRPFSMGTNPCFRTLVEPGLQLYPGYLCSAMAAKRLELSLWLSMHACVTRCFTFSKGPK